MLSGLKRTASKLRTIWHDNWFTREIPHVLHIYKWLSKISMGVGGTVGAGYGLLEAPSTVKKHVAASPSKEDGRKDGIRAAAMHVGLMTGAGVGMGAILPYTFPYWLTKAVTRSNMPPTTVDKDIHLKTNTSLRNP